MPKKQIQPELVSIALFDTALGWIGVALTGRGVASATAFHTSREEALAELRALWPEASLLDIMSLPDLGERLRRYARGEPVSFDGETFDLSRCTPFQRSVLRTIQAIPAGQTWTYADVARAIGRPRAARAVGQALARNPVPLMIPCHRVVGSDGGLRGYGGVGGVATKRRLLALERKNSPT
jgi:methylated-DNA-[protein]-cysteine S-methyltransferase